MCPILNLEFNPSGRTSNQQHTPLTSPPTSHTSSPTPHRRTKKTSPPSPTSSVGDLVSAIWTGDQQWYPDTVSGCIFDKRLMINNNRFHCLTYE